MNKARFTGLGWALLHGSILAAGLSMAAVAQDAVPETKPELKDFRLDKAPPKEKPVEGPPAPIPQTQSPPPVVETPRSAPAITPQPVPKVEASPEVRTERPATSTKPTAPAPTSATAEPAQTAKPAATAPAETLPATEQSLLPAPAEEPAAETVQAPPSAPIDWQAYWPALAALLALLLGYFGWRSWARREHTAPAQEIVFAPQEEESLPVTAALAIKLGKKATPAPLPPTGNLTASFEPSDARLSLANLTITGCLRLHYDGPEPLPSLRLRNQVISACDGQQRMIEAFHTDPGAGQIDMLSAVQPGEDIALTLELQVPRDALQAFDWKERRFVAPILLLNLSSEDGRITPCRINSLVGQESDALSPRMKPLPIDRGPKHFDALRFRPIAA